MDGPGWLDRLAGAGREARVADVAVLVDEAPDPGTAAWAEGIASMCGGAVTSSYLFSGLMVDRPGAAEQRFPSARIAAAAAAIRDVLDSSGVEDGLAVSSGACGGDLLFASSALERGMNLQLVLPYAVDRFVEKSVSFAGRSWVERFDAVLASDRCDLVVLEDQLGRVPESRSVFERTNTWMLASWARTAAAGRNLILLWDGKPGAGPGGTADMHARGKVLASRVSVIDPTHLGEGASEE